MRCMYFDLKNTHEIYNYSSTVFSAVDASR